MHFKSTATFLAKRLVQMQKESVWSTKGQHTVTGSCGVRTQRLSHHWPSSGDVWVRACNVWLPQCPTSPRMGHTLGEIFTHAQSLNLKNRNSWAGRARRSPRALQRAEPALARSQRAVVACKLRLKLLLADQPAKKADRRVRHYKEVGLPEWPLAGRATVPRGLLYRSLHVSSSERFFQKVYGRPLPWTSPFTLFARLTEPQVVVLPWSHGSGRGENLVTIARFVKPLFANTHHHVHAVAGTLRKPNVAMPAPRRPLDGQCDGDVIDAEFALRRCHLSSTEQIFFHLHSSLKT